MKIIKVTKEYFGRQRTRRFISSSLWKKKYPLRICRRLWDAKKKLVKEIDNAEE